MEINAAMAMVSLRIQLQVAVAWPLWPASRQQMEIQCEVCVSATVALQCIPDPRFQTPDPRDRDPNSKPKPKTRDHTLDGRWGAPFGAVPCDLVGSRGTWRPSWRWERATEKLGKYRKKALKKNTIKWKIKYEIG